ncbi:hypothetical protein HY948_02330 [Candidatus Gottesmanbacteria bacterium]|nr:hypothetical protein [Candidatus Gottesmanbacteria bacterium]
MIVKEQPQSIFLVIPTIRSLDFLSEWEGLLRACHLIVIEDNSIKQIHTPNKGFESIHHYSWVDIKKDFGKDEWIFSRRNAGIRSYGLWKAHQLGADVIITLDDDCYPTDRDFVARHVANLSLLAPEKWTTTFPHPDFLYTRGFPYDVRSKYPVVISHGLWSNKMDLDARTQLQHPKVNTKPYPPMLNFIPQGQFFPMSSMNLAFRREVTPLMYFPLMGSDPAGNPWGYDRFDDIWAGIFAKKICDHLGLRVVSGSPFVEHRKASDPQKNLEKERTGLAANETLWRAVDDVVLTSTTPAACYRELAQKVRFPKDRYFEKLRRAMLMWVDLFLASQDTLL